MTLIDPGYGRLSLTAQSSLREENLFANYGSSFEVLPLPTSFFFFRPFSNLWSSLVRATSTVYQTVTSTFLTTSYVESTTSTSTLFINKCGNPADSEILQKTLPECQQESSTASSTTPTALTNTPTTPVTTTESTTEAGTSTTSKNISITDQMMASQGLRYTYL